jgi:hypothetical protein
MIPEGIDDKYLLPPYHGAQHYLRAQEALPHFFQAIPIHIVPDDYDVLEPDCDGEYLLSCYAGPNFTNSIKNNWDQS